MENEREEKDGDKTDFFLKKNIKILRSNYIMIHGEDGWDQTIYAT